MAPIDKLLQKSRCGIQFRRQAQETVRQRMQALAQESNDFKRLIGFLEILQELALSKDAVVLEPQRVAAELAPLDLGKDLPHIRLPGGEFQGRYLAGQGGGDRRHGRPMPLRRYFKKITRKTFMETVIEYRLNHATQQLIQTDKPISDICFDSGFGDVSHFYKMFRAKTQLSPLHYRRKFMQETNAEGSHAIPPGR